MQYRDPVVLMDCPLNIEIGLPLFRKGTNNKWTYNCTKHLMVDFETIIEPTSMTCSVHIDAYELQPGDAMPHLFVVYVLFYQQV